MSIAAKILTALFLGKLDICTELVAVSCKLIFGQQCQDTFKAVFALLRGKREIVKRKKANRTNSEGGSGTCRRTQPRIVQSATLSVFACFLDKLICGAKMLD